MDQNGIEQLDERVLTRVKEGNVSTIVLAGKSGIGKTWMARKVGLLAVKKEIVDITLWVCLSVKHDERALYEHIARQLSLTYTFAEWENDDNVELEDSLDKEESLEALKEKIHARLSTDSVRRGVLVILDDEGNKMNEGDREIKDFLLFIQHNLSREDSKNKIKVLITSINKGNRHQTKENKVVIDMMPLTPDMSISLLQQKAGDKVFGIPGVSSLVEDFLWRKDGSTPGEVGLLAKLLSSHQHDSRMLGLQCALEEASRSESYSFTHLISSGYDKVPNGVLVDFSWQGSHFFCDHGLIHYSELISYWMMEGYLGPIDSVEKAYGEGCRILMELMDCLMLKKVSDDYLIMERAELHLNNYHHCGISGTANLGLANVFGDGYKWDGIGKVSPMDGAIRTLGSYRKGRRLYTLLLDGNQLSREDLNDVLQDNQELQILCLFNPRIVMLPRSLSYLKKLNTLVLRGCDFLGDINDIKDLKMLTVLEVSGSSSLKRIPDKLFMQLTQLRSLNLSALQIEVLPKSVYDLTNLRWLILKGCSHLTQLQSLRKFEKLVVLDLSSASSLETFPEKNLKSLPKLQILNLSDTKIKTLPILHQTAELTHLSLSGCKNMDRLPSIKSLTNLQVLDLSNSTIKEFHDKSFLHNCSLKILDLSGTAMPSDMLPSNISNPCRFYLRGCTVIKQFTCAESPSNLEILDLSNACNLVKIEGKFFDRLENLRVLNMTETKLKVLPPLSALHNLRQLLLSQCSDLVKLPTLTSLSKLEVLDLSDCKALTTIEDESFEHLYFLRRLSLCKTKIVRVPELKSLSNLEELSLSGVNSVTEADFLEHMCSLRSLDLSETLLEHLPLLSSLKNLSCLCLSGCKQLGSLPPLEELHKLEVLDLSQTAIMHLPSLEKMTNLRKLLLNDCSSLEEFANVATFDLSGAIIKNLPCGISRLTQLEHLVLPNMNNTQAVDGDVKKRLLEKMNVYPWSISILSGIVPHTNRSIVSVSGSEFLELLGSNPSFSNTTLNHFHLSVHPMEEQNCSGICIYEDQFICRDIYWLSKHFSHLRAQGQSIEFHNFHTFPKGIEAILDRAEFLFLFDSSFIESLADLGSGNIKKLKGCWMEGCKRLEFVINASEILDATELGETLEILWISNALQLRGVCSQSVQSGGFQNLKCLYLDCCPQLSTVLVSSHSLQNLATLQVRFCEKLEILFGHDRKEQSLPNLRTLHLWELPQLKGIGCIMPSLQVLEVGECPMLEHVLSSSNVPENLEVLKVRNCQQMNTLLEGFTSDNCGWLHLREVQLLGLPNLTSVGIEVPSLESLDVGDCPMLVHVFSSAHVPENLEVLKVRFCDNLSILFEGLPSGNCTMPNLNTVQLLGLPKLTSIGITLPTVQNSTIDECPQLTIPVF